ncbi:tubulin polymerization-promoting protein-like isoform X2 [Crotalus tigris]|uniref:tubulin polymerization-promoting protein-like isoform X2 n=1 Tax=Crotalus tigris TaxID=88082 RepID=UPI00192F1302|nr:tubulin polymerization-promoting protein-like isoform X2 [Crotalus tigris]
MASLESAFGEETMADINPSLARENSAATECSEFHFNANSLTEQGQLCILDPHSPEFVEGMSELEKTFLRFAAYGNTATHRNTMSRKNFYKMLKECDVMDGKVMTSTDVLIAFNEVK